jgi:membrane-bound lytic murein transglycosylase C
MSLTKFSSLLAAAFLISLLATSLEAKDPIEEAKKQWETQKKESEAKWDAEKAGAEKQWDELEKSENAKWEKLKAEVEQKWATFVHSTKKEWVAYDRRREARSDVDFEKGRITFEALVKYGDPGAEEKARKKIEDQVKMAFSRTDIGKSTVLEKQVATREGRKLTAQNLRKYLKEEVLPEVKPDPTPFQSRDGVKRRRYSVEINMVPDHIRIRAEKYLPLIEKNARRFSVKPQLVLAIIHTESYFNPEAVSSCNAVGLMQVIPRHAGREAYYFVYNQDKVISPEYLYDPKNNIELGCAYLHLLRYQHFEDVRGEVKNRYVTICGYNWGPTSMRAKIVDKYPINRMSDEDVYVLLREKTPEETRDYIEKVRERMPLYDALLDRG